MPGPTPVRTRVRNALAETRFPLRDPILRAVWRSYERALVVRDRLRPDSPRTIDDGLPLPPASMRVLVSGRAEADFFLASGREHRDFLRRLLADNGVEIAELGAILDLGCGCGRVVRWWRDLDGPAIHACDYNDKLVAWVGDNLPFVSAAQNELEPPLPYDDASLDFIYALSVFTHLTQEQERRWVAELARVLRPGGLAALTVMGEPYAPTLSESERLRFERGEVVTRFADVSGTNMCASFHPPEYVTVAMFGDRLEIVDSIRPAEHPERAGADLQQDTYLIKRRTP
jgi:SAM-dependent methyltransferase